MQPDGSLQIDWWIPLLAYGAIAAGTVWGGWKIIETMGLRITKLRASSGLAANIGAVTAIFGATGMGIPISTTHAAATSITGAGVASGQGVNLRVVLKMVASWIITIPSTVVIGWVMFQLTQLPGAAAWIAVGSVLFVLDRLDRLGHGARGARLRHRRRDPHRRGTPGAGLGDPPHPGARRTRSGLTAPDGRGARTRWTTSGQHRAATDSTTGKDSRERRVVDGDGADARVDEEAAVSCGGLLAGRVQRGQDR